MTQPASVGSHLLYTYQASDHCRKQAVGQQRPALVVRSWGACYNVQVFTDGVNDFDDKRMVLHLTSIQLSDCIAKGRLHYPGSPVEAAPEAPAAEPETSAPEGAQSEAATEEAPGTPAADTPTPAIPEAPKPIQTTIAPPSVLKKNKGGRPKKAAAK
jgi:hypothetical protein